MSMLRDCYILQKELIQIIKKNINEKLNETILRQNMA